MRLEMLAKDYGHSPVDQGELVSGFQRSSNVVNLYFIKVTLEEGPAKRDAREI